MIECRVWNILQSLSGERHFALAFHSDLPEEMLATIFWQYVTYCRPFLIPISLYFSKITISAGRHTSRTPGKWRRQKLIPNTMTHYRVSGTLVRNVFVPHYLSRYFNSCVERRTKVLPRIFCLKVNEFKWSPTRKPHLLFKSMWQRIHCNHIMTKNRVRVYLWSSQ